LASAENLGSKRDRLLAHHHLGDPVIGGGLRRLHRPLRGSEALNLVQAECLQHLTILDRDICNESRTEVALELTGEYQRACLEDAAAVERADKHPSTHVECLQQKFRVGDSDGDATK